MISIVIVNFNTGTLLVRLIESLRQFEKKGLYEIIVVDNFSLDNSIKIIQDDFPDVYLIENKTNVGFGAGNNIGVKAARGDYILLLNSDTYLREKILDTCIEACRIRGPAILGCRLVNPDGSEQVSTGRFPRLKTSLFEIFSSSRKFETLGLSYQNQILHDGGRVDWVTGAFMFMEKKYFMDLGGFNEKIFMYGEDMELCLRAAGTGIHSYYLSEVSIVHESSGSSRSEKRLVQLTDEGRLNFWKISNGMSYAILVRLIFILRSFSRLILFGLMLPLKPAMAQRVSVHFSALIFLLSGIKSR